MATRSTIAIKYDNGSFEQIYCHWDGYISGGVGDTLKQHYTDPAKVAKLLAEGDISTLGRNIGTKHDFDKFLIEETTFYGRDRGEDNTEARVFCDEVTFMRERQSQDYNYLFTNGEWKLINRKFDLVTF